MIIFTYFSSPQQKKFFCQIVFLISKQVNFLSYHYFEITGFDIEKTFEISSEDCFNLCFKLLKTVECIQNICMLIVLICFSCSCGVETNMSFAAQVTSLGTFVLICLVVIITFVSVMYDYFTSPAWEAHQHQAKIKAAKRKEEQKAKALVINEKRAIENQKKAKAQREKEALLLQRKLEKLQKKLEARELETIEELPDGQALDEQVVPVAPLASIQQV